MSEGAWPKVMCISYRALLGEHMSSKVKQVVVYTKLTN